METKATHTSNDLADERQRLLAQLLADEGIDVARDEPPITPRQPGHDVPVTYAQEVLWLLDRATPGLTAYNTPVARRLRGPLDVARLERALSALVERHETLRTVFAARGDGAVQVVQPAAPVRLTMHDMRDLAPAERERAAIAALRVATDTPFDLTREPGFRA